MKSSRDKKKMKRTRSRSGEEGKENQPCDLGSTSRLLL